MGLKIEPTTIAMTIMKLNKTIFLLLIPVLLFSNTLKASDINKGRKIYQLHCVMCHGVNGKNTMVGAADFSRGEGMFQSDHSLRKRIKSGKNACPAYLGILTDQKIFDVIAYLRTLN